MLFSMMQREIYLPWNGSRGIKTERFLAAANAEIYTQKQANRKGIQQKGGISATQGARREKIRAKQASMIQQCTKSEEI